MKNFQEFLKSFLLWLDFWDEIKIPGQKHLSDSTRKGLRVTITATLNLLDYLVSQHNFKYLMTDRLNQDALEVKGQYIYNKLDFYIVSFKKFDIKIFQNFFGALRYNGGLNNHPTSSNFANLYRLMSTYSLIKPPKGSNVSGGKILETILEANDIIGDGRTNNQNKSKEAIGKIILDILDKGTFDPNEKFDMTKEELEGVVEGYTAGYVAKVASKRWCQNCAECKSLLSTSKPRSAACNLLIENRSYGYLTYPSDPLIKLIFSLESKIKKYLMKGLTSRTFFDVMRSMTSVKLPRIGCTEHWMNLTQSIIYFYATTRMHFASRVEKQMNTSRAKSKELIKKSKLVTKSSGVTAEEEKKKQKRKVTTKIQPTVTQSVLVISIKK
jgi:hypothetical protein